jgi:hypothetical protein
MSLNTDALRHAEHLHASIAMQDITYGRHHGNPESNAAFSHGASTRENDRQQVLELIQECPRSMKEVARMMGKGFNAVAGRGSELKALGLVEKTGEVRAGSAVLRAV